VTVVHAWDSVGASVFCPVRKLKVYGHFILMKTQSLLILCTCTCFMVLKITEDSHNRNVIFHQDDTLLILDFWYLESSVDGTSSSSFVDSLFTRPYTDKRLFWGLPTIITSSHSIINPLATIVVRRRLEFKWELHNSRYIYMTPGILNISLNVTYM
jgi:hypothetical protein